MLRHFIFVSSMSLLLSGCGSTPNTTSTHFVSVTEFNELKQSHQQLEQRIAGLLAVEQELKAVILALDEMMSASKEQPNKQSKQQPIESNTLTPNADNQIESGALAIKINPPSLTAVPLENDSSNKQEPSSSALLPEQPKPTHSLQLALFYSSHHVETYQAEIENKTKTLNLLGRLAISHTVKPNKEEYRLILEGYTSKKAAVEECEKLTQLNINCFYKRF